MEESSSVTVRCGLCARERSTHATYRRATEVPVARRLVRAGLSTCSRRRRQVGSRHVGSPDRAVEWQRAAIPASNRSPVPAVTIGPRSRKVLGAIGDHPGISSRGVAAAAGIADEGQASKILARLALHQLVHESADWQLGKRHSWRLTHRGWRALLVASRPRPS